MIVIHGDTANGWFGDWTLVIFPDGTAVYDDEPIPFAVVED